MKVIARLLQDYRTVNGLTQARLAEELQKYSDSFGKLTIVTLSRWETATTEPGIKRKQALLKFLYSRGCFKNQACRMLIREQYGSLQEGLEKEFDRHFKHLIGNFPESDTAEYTVSALRNHPDRMFYYEQIIQIDIASKPVKGDYPVTAEMLARWCEHPSTFAIVCESNRQHAGHNILLKLKNSVAEDIVRHRRPFHSFTKDDLCNVEEKGTYLNYTFFARSGKIAALLNVQHYYHLIDHMNTIDAVAIFSRREDTIAMTKNYGIHLKASGIDAAEGLQWYGLSAPLEDILFSDTVVGTIY